MGISRTSGRTRKCTQYKNRKPWFIPHVFGTDLGKIQKLLWNEPLVFKKDIIDAAAAVSSLREETVRKEKGLLDTARQILKNEWLVLTRPDNYVGGLTEKMPPWCIAICADTLTTKIRNKSGFTTSV